MAQEALIPLNLIKQEPEEFCQLVCSVCLQETQLDVSSSCNTTPENVIEEDDGPRENEQCEDSGSMEYHCNGTSSSNCMDDIFYSDEDDGSEEEEQREGSVGMETPCIGSAPSTSYMTVTTHIVTEVYTLYYYKQ